MRSRCHKVSQPCQYQTSKLSAIFWMVLPATRPPPGPPRILLPDSAILDRFSHGFFVLRSLNLSNPHFQAGLQSGRELTKLSPLPPATDRFVARKRNSRVELPLEFFLLSSRSEVGGYRGTIDSRRGCSGQVSRKQLSG